MCSRAVALKEKKEEVKKKKQKSRDHFIISCSGRAGETHSQTQPTQDQTWPPSPSLGAAVRAIAFN